MKHILFVISILIPAFGYSQSQILKTAGIPYTAIAPTYTPSASGSNWAIDTTMLRLYVWTGSAWILAGERIQTVSGCASPVYTPGKGQSVFVINGCDSLYYYRAGDWRHINKSGAAASIDSTTARNTGATGQGVYSHESNNALNFRRLIAGAGMTLTGADSSITVTNAAPDQTVVLTGAGINAVTGTYPNFTITGTEIDGSVTNEIQSLSLSGQALGITGGSGVTLPVVGVSAGTGINVSTTNGVSTITNAAPDQTVTITGAGINNVSGSYPNFTITGTEVDGSVTNEIQTLGLSGQTLSISSGNNVSLPIVNVSAGTGTTVSITSGNATVSANDASATNEIQSLSLSGQTLSISSSNNVTLPIIAVSAGAGISVSTASGTATVTNAAPDQTVTITGAGINAVTGSYPAFTITGTEVDGSVTNEGRLGVGAGLANTSTITTNTSGSNAITLSGGGIVFLSETVNTNGGTITISATEVDGSVTNEGSLTVGAGGANNSVIQSNTSGSPNVTIAGGTNVNVTEAGNTITISATAAAGDGNGIYSGGTDTVPANTYAVIQSDFTFQYIGGVPALAFDSQAGRVSLYDSTLTQEINIQPDSIQFIGTKFKFVGDTIDISDVEVKIGFPAGGTVTLDGEVNGPSTATTVDTVRRIWFDRDYNQPDSLAKLQWNAGDRTLDLGMGSTAQFNVLQIGQETLYPHAINKQAATIKKGVPVMVDTVAFVQGDNIRIMPATGSGSRPASTIMGLATHDIPFDSVGFVTWFGYVTEVVEADIAQTGITLNAGDILYVSGTQHGRLTNVVPTAPQLKIPIAILVRKQNVNNLTLLVRPNLTQDIHELNDVSVTSPTAGQVLEWNAAGYWENGQVGTAGIEANAIDSSKIAVGGVGNSDIAANTIDSTKIRNAGISVLDIGVNGASNGQVLKYNGTQWAPAADDNTGTNLTFTGSGSPFNLNSSTGTGVTIASGTGITLTRATNQLTVTNSAPDQTVSITGAGINTVTGTYPTFTITGTEVDGSITNEGRLGVGAGVGNAANITTNTSGSSDVIISGGGILSVTETTGTNGGTITLTATEVDGSVSNEGSLTVATGGSNDSQITSNTSGSTAVTIAGGANVTVTESGNTITISSSGASGVSDGDKGDIDVTNTGATWTVDTAAVNNLKLASGTGGVYKSSGTIPDGTAATVTSNGTFSLNYHGGTNAIQIDDTQSSMYLYNKSGSSIVSLEQSAVNLYANGPVTVGRLSGTPALRIMEPSASGSNFTQFQTAAQSADITYTLPASTGSNGQFLQFTTGGNLQWATPSGGGGGMTSWTLAGTSGTAQTVSDGQTATIAAGSGIISTAGATRTVTVQADTSLLATLNDLEIPRDTALKATTHTAAINNIALIDCKAAPRTVNPPASAINGDWFVVSDARASSGANNITVNFVGAGQKVYGVVDNYILNSNGAYVKFIYVNANTGWIATKG